MSEICINSTNYSPNIRFLSNHIITFDDNSIFLYDLKGNQLDFFNTGIYCIKDIIIINNNNLIAISDFNRKFT